MPLWLAMAGCEQSEGDACLLDDDCEAGLTCDEERQICIVPPDAGQADAD